MSRHRSDWTERFPEAQRAIDTIGSPLKYLVLHQAEPEHMTPFFHEFSDEQLRYIIDYAIGIIDDRDRSEQATPTEEPQ